MNKMHDLGNNGESLKIKESNLIDFNSNDGIANNLLNNFGSKYVHLKDNKLLFEEFLYKYEILSKECIVESKCQDKTWFLVKKKLKKQRKK